MTIHIVQFSTGLGSAEVAWLVVEQYGPQNVVLLTADTLVEDEDNWRFATEVSDLLGVPITRLADGRTPMEAGRDERVVPNNRLAVCSRILKRDLLRRHLAATYNPANVVIYLGFDWTETHRLDAALPHWKPWTVRAPLIGPPYPTKDDLLDRWRSRGIEPPRLYDWGFRHANCGGACVRGGQAQWGLLLRVHRDRYLAWEAEEERTRAELDKDVSILRDRRGGQTRPLTLAAFRDRLEAGGRAGEDWGPCGCAETLLTTDWG
jgi:hypothetical protein